MAKTLTITPTSKPIKAYYAALRDLSKQQVSHEQAVRSAFQSLLTDLAKPLKWTAIPELGKKVRTSGKKTRIIPDGTLRDRFQLPRGYWEAKDSADNLDAEINSKIKQGYPTDNTIFWTPDAAVLFQGGVQKLKVPISEKGDHPNLFCDLLTAFFTYIDKPLVDFDEAVETFTERVPAVGAELAKIIADAHKSNNKFKQAFAAFFDLCKTTLNPNISQQAVDEMLVQHLLTKRLFSSVFKNPEFLQKNVIASEVEKVIAALQSRHFNPADFLKELDHFYIAIENAADRVHDWSSKQHFLNTVYERFFQGYCVKTADTHGIVYTPQPIVDFMCASVEWVLETEFGKKLGDDGVNILDPCTGTGNFVVNLIRRAAERGPKHLHRMYTEQLFANEIMLMPYYIAALNIEHEFYEHTGEYEPFEGLCFVDTLDMNDLRQREFGFMVPTNTKRVERQKKTEITVVVGNPPYNMHQADENDNNKNRKYKLVDDRVRTTYAKDSLATNKIGLRDPYVKFFRWATDRLGARDGIVCFVSNNGFVDDKTYDGMRKHLLKDFSTVWHLNLHGNVRHDPDKSGTQYNVFGIQVGVGITVAVRRRGGEPSGLRYGDVNKELRRYEKLRRIEQLGHVAAVEWSLVRPSPRHDWVSRPEQSRYETFVAIASKAGRSQLTNEVLFREYSAGLATCRDDVVYDFDQSTLAERVRHFVELYNAEVDRYKRTGAKKRADDFVDYSRIKWSETLKKALERFETLRYDPSVIRSSVYRAFTRRWVYFGEIINERRYGLPEMFPPAQENLAIAFSDVAFRSDSTSALMIDCAPDFHLSATLDRHQCVSRWWYDEDGTNRRDNITDWALSLFRSHFTAVSPAAAKSAAKITKHDIFHYVYAILHHKGYRDTFAENLKRELPRIPLAKSYDEFEAFVTAGEKLAKLHLSYDDEKVVKPYKLREEWTLTDQEGRKRPKSWRVEDKMRLTKDKSSLVVNDLLTLHDIPAAVFSYRLGNRSALEWVIDQYQVYTDPKTNITSDCNKWGEERNDPEYIVRLVKQVVTVSLETVKLVDGLPKDFGGPPVIPSASDPEPPSKATKANGKHAAAEDGFELRADVPRASQRRLRS